MYRLCVCTVHILLFDKSKPYFVMCSSLNEQSLSKDLTELNKKVNKMKKDNQKLEAAKQKLEAEVQYMH